MPIGKTKAAWLSVVTAIHLCFIPIICPKGVWSDIRIEGDYKGTSLYVNGKLQERLEGRTKKVYRQQYKRMEYMEYQETLIFPLQQIGDGLNGFKGKIKNVVCKQF